MIFNLTRRLRLAKARKARAIAFQALQDAKARGDTRDIHHANKALYVAHHNLMAAESRAPVGYIPRPVPALRGRGA